MENEVVSLKLLLGISDSSKDEVLNFYIVKAKNSIRKYCLLTKEEYLANADLLNPTVELALFYYQNSKNIGLKSYGEGTKGKTFETGDIPSSIKATLPSPPIFSM